ncbi:DUF2493 domain-containing protein [Niallia circulans]|uniref:DUF2493 domain-containing protein n=1 Tax=Niallia circulans TaxID=1397 RepID=UPI0026F30F69|nr:DUF2493 domain-containing protein [Niallia circulans]
MRKLRVIVAGGRDFNDYVLLKTNLDYVLRNRQVDEVVIVSGKARGADSLGELYAKERGLEVSAYPADWDTYGKSAGYIRNKQMAETSHALMAFWDGKSRGTKHMIDLAKEKGLRVQVVPY